MARIIVQNLHLHIDDADEYKEILSEILETYSRVTEVDYYATYAIIHIVDKNSLKPVIRFLRREVVDEFSFTYSTVRGDQIMSSLEEL